MKANEAPEKIYVHKSQYWGLMANEHNITKDGIEYTCTDAFIEKACAFLKDRIEHDSIDYPMATHYLIDDFKNYMKGE